MRQTINVTAPMLPELERQARIEAAKAGISRAELIRRAVVAYLKQLTESKEAGVQNG